MKFPFYIAKRYLISKSSNNAINFITKIAGFGVIIGAAALFIVLSGFAGLKDFTLQFSSFSDPDLKIIPAQGKSFTFSENTLNEISSVEGVASYSKIIEEQVLVNYEDKNESVLLKGVDENYPQTTIDSILYRGNWFNQNSNDVVAGLGVSNNLSFGILDFTKSLSIYVPKPGKGQVASAKSAFNSMTAFNVGVFQINEDIDHSVIFTNFNAAKYLLNYKDDQFSALEVVLNNPEDTEEIGEQIQNILGGNVIVKNRLQLNDSLHKMLNSENLFVYLLLTLVSIILIFNIIGSLIMMILDKRKNLNTLFNLGLTIKDIRNIFFMQGATMTIVGVILGLVLGYIIVVIQKTFALVMITASLPYPMSIKTETFIVVFLTISVLGVIASKLASSRISKQLVTSV